MCIILKDVGRSKKNKYVSKEGSVHVHRCERTASTNRSEIFMNCTKNIIGICQKQICVHNLKYKRDHRCEGTNMVYKNI